ncbi:MAG: hypothetical protein R3195_15080 [Gemmatimonadota bacterium]|nr:hypothetical protein [Gemmatimonadota bacterium]
MSRQWKLRLRTGAMVAPILALAACDGDPLAPASADDDVAALRGPAAHTVPIRLEGTVLLVGPVAAPDPGCLLHAASVIEGRGTMIGPFAGTGETCILSQTVPDPSPPFTAPGPPPYGTAEFTNPRWTLTARSGDELWLAADEATAVLSAVDNTLRARGTHRIVGGTGRFDGAVGVLSTSAINELGTGPDHFTSRGWIRLKRPRR